MSIEKFEKELIDCLIRNKGKVSFSNLPKIFKEMYNGKELTLQRKQLRKFIESTPTLNIDTSKMEPIVSLAKVIITSESSTKSLPVTELPVLKKDSPAVKNRILPQRVVTIQRNTHQLHFSEVVVDCHHNSHITVTIEPTVYLLGQHHRKRSRGQINLSHLLVNGVRLGVGCSLLGIIPESENLNNEEYKGYEEHKAKNQNESEETIIGKRKLLEVEVEETNEDYSNEEADLVEREHSVYIQTAAPFCAVCIGVQGAGKSHTMNVILENCMLPTYSNRREITTNIQPMTGLVLHYDQSESNVCEAVGLYQSNHTLSSIEPSMKVQRIVVLVSPNYYHQRKAFYEEKCEVYPLLFDWSHLTATHLRKLMRLTESDSQLYVSVMLNKLRTYQRNNEIPVFEEFVKDIQSECNVSGQSAPLQQVGREIGRDSSGCSFCIII